MDRKTTRPEDLLNERIDALLSGELTILGDEVVDADNDLGEMMGIADLLAEAFGAPVLEPAARASARDSFLDAARKRARLLEFRAAPHFRAAPNRHSGEPSTPVAMLRFPQ